jgi:hypothetical protein
VIPVLNEKTRIKDSSKHKFDELSLNSNYTLTNYVLYSHKSKETRTDRTDFKTIIYVDASDLRLIDQSPVLSSWRVEERETFSLQITKSTD